MRSRNRKNISVIDERDITDIWDITNDDLLEIKDQLHRIDSDLDVRHGGKYYDYQIVDDLFDDLSDVQKAKIFIYGQWIHHRMYKKI